MLAAIAIGLVAGCLHEASQNCGSRGVCPPGSQCAEAGDNRICVLVTCGNGKLDPAEACDDGNNRSGDGCPADCTPPCGDGVLDPGEACDDGNTVDGDGCSADCRTLDSVFLVSPPMVQFAATEGDALPASATVTIHLLYRGDSVLVGYPPGVQQASWLAFSGGASTTTTAEFQLQVGDTTTVGQRSTSVRFVVSHQTSTGLDTFDLPVSYSVTPSDLAVAATPSRLTFAAVAGGALPGAQTAEVTFNGASATVVQAPAWLTVSAPPAPMSSPASFSVTVNSTGFTAGTALSGDIVFGTSNAHGTLQRTAIVHVDYTVAAFTPGVHFVAPYIGVAGRGGRLHVRGRGFQMSGGPITLGIGDVRVGPVTPDADSQVVVSYPPLPAGRYPITVVDPPGDSPMGAELVVVAPTSFAYQAIDAPGRRRRLIYDAERLALYGVNRDDQDIEHFVYTGTSWSALAPHVVPQLTDIAMARNGRSLIVVDRDRISETSLADGQFTLVPRVGNPDPFCGGFFDQAVPANNGLFYVIFDLAECSGFTSWYLYNMLDGSLSGHFGLYNGLAGASGDGSRIYTGSDGISPAEPIHIFDSLTGTNLDSTADFNLHAISVSDDASRVIIQDSLVYSRTLSLTGNLRTGGVALASHDSSRAFVYVEDSSGARLDVYNLNGPLQPGALYPLLGTALLPDRANGDAFSFGITMTSSADDATVFVSGRRKLLVVPVN
jgi:cysteine-rich repeat protein